MHIQVGNLVGEHAITIDDGQAVYQQVIDALRRGEPVELNFDRVSVFASPFFNAAIGQLLGEFSPDDLNRRVGMTNLSAVGQNVLRQVIENAKQYYASADYREAQRRVLEAMAAEM